MRKALFAVCKSNQGGSLLIMIRTYAEVKMLKSAKEFPESFRRYIEK